MLWYSLGYFFSRPDDFLSKLAKTPRTNPEFTVQIERANTSVVSPRQGDSRIIHGSFDRSISFRFNRGALHLFKAHGSSLGLNLDALDGQTLIISAIKATRFRCIEIGRKYRKSKVWYLFTVSLVSFVFIGNPVVLWLFVLLGVI